MASALRARGGTRAWRRIRDAVLLRDGYRCQMCGGYATHVDHIQPRMYGGTDTWDNLRASCRRCNQTRPRCYYVTVKGAQLFAQDQSELVETLRVVKSSACDVDYVSVASQQEIVLFAA